jgi:hypothetical protein
MKQGIKIKASDNGNRLSLLYVLRRRLLVVWYIQWNILFGKVRSRKLELPKSLHDVYNFLKPIFEFTKIHHTNGG